MGVYIPKEDVFVAVFSNCDCNSPEETAIKMAAVAIDKPYINTEKPLQKEAMQEYVGVYDGDNGEQRIITLTDSGMYSQRGRNPKFKIKSYDKDKFYFNEALMSLEFLRGTDGKIEKLVAYGRDGSKAWTKTNAAAKTKTEIKLDDKILEKYIGEYQIAPQFILTVTKEASQLFVQATGQSKLAIYPESETSFFIKEVDADLEFVKDNSGKIIKAILHQGGRHTDANKTK